MKGLFVLEDFHPYPDNLRTIGLSARYEDWLGPDGQVYKRIYKGMVPGIAELIEGILGPVEMLGMGYRLNFNNEVPNQAIHSDLGWGTHALVLYLSEGLSGTAFWRHKETGAVRIDPGDTELFETINKDWDDKMSWEMVENVAMKFNRALIYESALFHSRYPFDAFGDSPEAGRLIVVAFFTPENKV